MVLLLAATTTSSAHQASSRCPPAGLLPPSDAVEEAACSLFPSGKSLAIGSSPPSWATTPDLRSSSLRAPTSGQEISAEGGDGGGEGAPGWRNARNRRTPSAPLGHPRPSPEENHRDEQRAHDDRQRRAPVVRVRPAFPVQVVLDSPDDRRRGDVPEDVDRDGDERAGERAEAQRDGPHCRGVGDGVEGEERHLPEGEQGDEAVEAGHLQGGGGARRVGLDRVGAR